MVNHWPRPSPPALRLARGLAREASTACQTSSSCEASHGRPRTGGLDEEPILCLARGPTRKASNETMILRIARGRLGNNPSLLPRPVSLTERHVPLMRQPLPRYQSDDGSTLQSGRRDGKSHQRHTITDRTGQGLPATVLWCCAHDQRPHYTVPPNPCPRNNAVWGVKSGSP